MSDLFSEETIQKIMGEDYKSTSRYVSCIRINGYPILPPLINERYRSELIHYRNAAILMEKKIRDRKSLQVNRHSVDSGVIINASSGESSWLAPLLQSGRNDFSTCQTLNNKQELSCSSHCAHHSNSSDDNSSKNLMYEDDIWRYLSNCGDEQISSAWFDNQTEELLSNFDTSPPANLNPSNLTLTNFSQIVAPNESTTVRARSISDKSEVSVDKGDETLTRLSVFYAEYSKANDNENTAMTSSDPNAIYEEHEISELFRSYNCQVNQENESNCSVCASNQFGNPEYFNKCVMDQSNKNPDNTMPSWNKYEVNKDLKHVDDEYYYKNLEATTCKLNTDVDCSYDRKKSEIVSPEEHITALLTCNANVDNQDLENVDYQDNSPVKVEKESEIELSSLMVLQANKLSNIKISCSSVSLPEYPYSFPRAASEKQKPEKPYDPKYYGEYNGDSSSDKDGREILKSNENKANSNKMVKNNLTDSGSEESCRDAYKSTIVEDSPYLENLENSFKSQKTDVPLSDSVSVSEIDFCSSSIATAAQDTPEDMSEFHPQSSAEPTNELTPPKLVRQNSYTLIAPSPVLLAHVKAAEKQEEKTSSEEEYLTPKGRKDDFQTPQEVKSDKNYKKGIRYVYAVPCKQHPCIDQSNKKNTNKQSDNFQSNKVMSLPGSSASSPVKVKLFHSSLDNLPIVTVRRFQEIIDSKSNDRLGDKNVCRIKVNSSQKSPSEKVRSSSMELQKLCHSPVSDVLQSRSKSDLHESKGKQTLQFNSSCQEAKSSVRNVKQDIICKTDFNSSRFSPQQLSMNDVSSPKMNVNNQSNIENRLHSFNTEASFKDNENDKQENEQISICKSFPLNNASVEQIFLQLQNQHGQLMARLLEKQKKEQEALANTFLNQQRQLLQEMKLIPAPITDAQFTSNSDGFSLGRFSPSMSPNNITCRTTESQLSSEETHFNVNSASNRFCRYIDPNINHDQQSGVSRSEEQLIKPQSTVQRPNQTITQEQRNAATIINAYARGYLVRRLLRTEHVQEIINTISESVQCALQLQRECPVDITPSDIELHRRLIQQLTAACYSLHDTFFALTLQEKMNIIAFDREKRRNPATRPLSARSSLSAATQKYIQRKQQNRQSEHTASNTRRSWWRSKTRACSAGRYEQSSSSYSKQHSVVTPKQPSNNRAARRPWR